GNTFSAQKTCYVQTLCVLQLQYGNIHGVTVAAHYGKRFFAAFHYLSTLALIDFVAWNKLKYFEMSAMQCRPTAYVGRKRPDQIYKLPCRQRPIYLFLFGSYFCGECRFFLRLRRVHGGAVFNLLQR